ncbi:fumarylacetoacetate hydrolase family protein [Pseudomonadota bacterium]
MKIGQCIYQGSAHVFVINDAGVFVLDACKVKSTLQLIDECGTEGMLSGVVTKYLDNNFATKVAELESQMMESGIVMKKPVDSLEAWAVGVTYRRQALEHDRDLKKKLGKTDDLYTYVYSNERAEVFFKGIGRTVIGPSDDLWLRPDSSLVMPEAELVLIIGSSGLPVGYTLGNDLTAWDIESECPLYLNQAKIWQGSGAVGPYIVPVECAPEAYSFELRCVVKRAGQTVIDSSGSTAGLKRTVEELCYYMNFANKVAPGTVLYTGTTCVIDHNFALQAGDVVEVSSPAIGCLRNEIQEHEFPERNFPLREGVE